MMKKTVMTLRLMFCGLLCFTAAAFAAEPKLTLYVPFDGNDYATIAGGNAVPKYGIKDGTPEFAPGLSGKGFLTGGSNQQLTFDAAGNISPDQWTITFWVKGLPGAQWNGGKNLQGFWELTGEQGEIMWFYRYTTRPTPWLFARPKKGQGDSHWLFAPKAPEEEWHYWAVSWRKGSGAYLYLDGQLVGQSPCQPPDPVKTISIGQPANQSVQNKIIDEFKIYDTALDSGAIARRYWKEGDFALQPTLTVSPTRQKMTIDGKINAAEWQNAAGFTGLVDPENWSISAPQTWGKITYDDQNLYLALHSDNPPEVKSDPDNAALHGLVKNDATQNGPAVKEDDSFVVHVIPSSEAGTVYSLYVNGIDTTYAFTTSKNAADNAAWQSSANIKSIVNMNGWSLEASIPLQSFGVNHIADGDIWKMDFARVWKLLRQRTDLWAPGMRLKNQEGNAGFGTVHFAGDTTAVADLQQLEIAQDGHITAQANISNTTNKSQELLAVLSVADKNVQQQSITLQPGESKQITLQDLPKKANGALVEVTVQNGGKVLLRQSAPVILEQVGQLNLWKYPTLGQIRLGWAVQGSDDAASLSLSAQIKNTAGKTLQNVELESLSSQNGSTVVDVKNLPDGKYTLEMQIKKGDGILQQQAFPYEKKALPDWLGNTLGISDTPPPPWTDIKVDQAKDALSIWGRTYDYAGYLLPEQIINQGENMLAAPMRFVVKGADGAAQLSGSAKADDAKWTQINAVHSASKRSQKLGPVNLTAESYVEFDGMTWMDLTVTPQSPKVLLNGLTIEIPLKAEWAKLIKPYDDYKLQQTGLLPAKGWKGNASSMPWIGNADGGFQFFQESTANWMGSKTSEIVADGKGAFVLRVHLIDAPATLDKPLHFAFGWITSPVKAAPRDHRDWRLFNTGPFASDPKGTGIVGSYIKKAVTLNPGIQPYLPWWQGWWWLPEKFDGNPDRSGLVPVPAPDKTNAIRDYYGIKFFGAPYGRLTEMGTANSWFEQFGDEWVPNNSKYTPDVTLPPARQITKVSQGARSLRDFYAWGYNQLLKDGNVQALYFDVSRPLSDTNIYHGAGTTMPDGSIESSRNILGTRRTFQRIYTLMKKYHPNGRVFYHMSGEIILPVDSFVDALIDGENYTGILNRKANRGYEKVLSVDQFRTEYSTQNNFGPASIFLPEFDRSGAILKDEWKDLGYGKAQYLLGLVLLHDSDIWWAYFPYNVLADAYAAIDETGWNSNWKFVPYWHQKYFSLPDGVYTSIYQSPDGEKDILVIMNTSGKDQQIVLPMTLGKSTFSTAKAIYPDPQQLPNGKNASLKVLNNNFQIVLLEK